MISHENGAKRSEMRPKYNLIPREAMDAIAERFTKGLKYGKENWKNGGPEFFEDAINHVLYHLMDYANGNSAEETPEQNLGAALWGCAVLCWWERTGKKQWLEGPDLPPKEEK